MVRLLFLLLPCFALLLTFIAYQLQTSDNKERSRIPEPSNREKSPAANLSEVPLYPGVRWEPSARGHYFFAIEDRGEVAEIAGSQTESEIMQDMNDSYTRLRDYYQEELTRLGWQENVWSAAGGPDGSVFGYRKGKQYVNIGVSRSAGLLHSGGPRAFITISDP